MLMRCMRLISVPMSAILVFVAACNDANSRSILVADEEQAVCVPLPADLTASEPQTAPYYITLGRAELESTTPRDDQGASDDIYAFMRRRDTVIEARIADVVDHLRRAESRLNRLADQQDALRRAGDDTGAVDERIRNAREERDRIAAEEDELRQLVSGTTPTLSRQGTNIFFNDWPMPFRVYEGDTVEVRISERDPFQDDLLGHTEFVVDVETLEIGRVELRTGWVQSLPLGFAPCT